ncbi:MAG: aminopeptidase [Erysipelotrichaceae bacterium]
MKTKLEKYAELAVIKGANVQKGQMLVINCPVEHYEFARMCARVAHEAGARNVEVRFNDDQLNKLAFEHTETEVLKKISEWVITRQKEAIEHNCAFLHIISDQPGLLKDIPAEKLQEVQMEMYKEMDQFRYYTTANHGQWSIVALPNVAWAKKIFTSDSDEVAVQKLEDAIYRSVRIDDEHDPIELWNEHNQSLAKRIKMMNEYHFDRLHFKNDLGTDLVVELNPQHIWAGGDETTLKGVHFNPNMPTEEIFTMPKRTGVNGVVYSTKPLSYQGKLIEDFHIEFKDGKAISWDAKKEKDALTNLIQTDEGSCYLGEVALISDNSPISNMDILFLNTLFDENASCHLALGSAYPTNMVDGEKMSKEEMLANECNVSMTHADFMFGSPCMRIVGKGNNQEVVLFESGNFVA